MAVQHYCMQSLLTYGGAQVYSCQLKVYMLPLRSLQKHYSAVKRSIIWSCFVGVYFGGSLCITEMKSEENVQLEIFESKFLPAAVFADVTSKPHRLNTDTHRQTYTINISRPIYVNWSRSSSDSPESVLGSETAVLWQDQSQTDLSLILLVLVCSSGLGLILLVFFPTLLCTTRRCMTW